MFIKIKYVYHIALFIDLKIYKNISNLSILCNLPSSGVSLESVCGETVKWYIFYYFKKLKKLKI